MAIKRRDPDCTHGEDEFHTEIEMGEMFFHLSVIAMRWVR